MDGISGDGDRNYLSEYLLKSSASVVTIDVGQKTASHPAFALLNLKNDQIRNNVEEETLAYVQSAYRKPPKQKTAMHIKKANCEIMARNESTIKLFFSVTKANLKGDPFS